MIQYKGLIQRLKDRKLTRTTLVTALGISSRTIAKIGHEERISDRVLRRIANYLECSIDELYEVVSDNPVLRYNIVPFIIEDKKKGFYYRGLSEWDWETGYLMDTCLDGQDTFRRLLAMFDIEVVSPISLKISAH